MELGLRRLLFLVQELYFASSPGVWHEIRPSVHGDLRSKTDFLIPISADEKGATSALGYWPIIRPLSSSFTLLGDSFRLLYVTIPPSLSIRSQSANICWLSFWPGFVTSPARNWPTFLFLFSTVSLWRLVNSNTEGLGNFLISLLSVVDHVTRAS